MAATEPDRFDEALRSRTTRFLDELDAVVDRLPSLIAQYDGPESVEDRVADIRTLESDCDRTARDIGSLIANADVTDLGIRLTRVHLHAGRSIELFQRLDEIANTVEQFAEELDAVGPDPAARVLAILHEMAAIAADAMLALRNAVLGYIDMLCDVEGAHSIAADVHEIRALESDVDSLRNDAIAAAFDLEGRDALVYREFALMLDTLVDTMEDVTDHMILSAGNRAWLDLEPDVDPDDGLPSPQ